MMLKKNHETKTIVIPHKREAFGRTRRCGIRFPFVEKNKKSDPASPRVAKARAACGMTVFHE
jgi:hypothetical protein